MFDTQLFKDNLNTSWLGHNFFYFEELGSTNTYAKSLNKADSLQGSLVLADKQSKGRGQYERNWESVPGENLTFSLILEPGSADRLTILTLAFSLAVADVCEVQLKSSAKLKWPNDILVEGKKIGGLLTEAIFNGSALERLIIGIGLNVNQKAFSSDLRDNATSLSILTKEDYSREKLLTAILTKAEFYYRLWLKKDIELIKSINKRLIGYGTWVKLDINGCEKEGEFKFLGINENGALVVLNKDLEVDTFSYEQIRIYPV